MAEMFRMFPLSPGLVDGKHRQNMGLAIWEFLWFLEHVTSDESDGKGKFDGIVDFGNSISAARVAREIASSARNVQRNIQKLVSTGYLIRKRALANGHSYVVTNSKRWLWKRAHPVGIPTMGQSGGATESVAGVRQNPSPDATESVTRRDGICRSNKESKSRRAEEQNPKPLVKQKSLTVTVLPVSETKPTDVQVEFLYGLYPRKVHKISAKRAIRKAAGEVMKGDPDHPAMPLVEALDFLAQRIRLYAQAVQGSDRQYIPHPASWFNSGAFWDDEREWANVGSSDRQTGKPNQRPPRSASGQVIEQFARFAHTSNGGGRPQ
jgi:hypothetical protein